MSLTILFILTSIAILGILVIFVLMNVVRCYLTGECEMFFVRINERLSRKENPVETKNWEVNGK